MFGWGVQVPVHAGINIELHETAPVRTDSQSTCSNQGGSRSSDDDTWPFEPAPNANNTDDYHAEVGSLPRGRAEGIFLLQRKVILASRSPSGLEASNNTSLELSVLASMGSAARPSFAQVAQAYLPLPGNGRARQVAFNASIEVNGAQCHDPCMGNPFMSHFKDMFKGLAGPDGQDNPCQASST